MTYSVVVNDNIHSIILTDPDGAQQVIALDVTEGYADRIAKLLNVISKDWIDNYVTAEEWIKAHPLPDYTVAELKAMLNEQLNSSN